MIKTDIIIIGAGPVGLFTVFEAGLLKLRCHLIDALAEPGGQCAEIYPKKPIYDIPGFPSILARELIDNLMEQIKPFEPGFTLEETAIDILKKENNFIVSTKQGTKHIAPVVVIAGGLGVFIPRRPAIENIKAFENKGIDYIVKDPEKYRGKSIVISGGGDSALDWALYFANNVCKNVTIVHRSQQFRAHNDSVQKATDMTKEGKINMLLNAEVTTFKADDHIEAVSIKKKGKEDLEHIKCDYWLPLFGLTPKLGPIAKWGLEIEKNAIKVNNALDYSTNIPGIYAIGDVNTYQGKLKLILCGFHEAAIMMQSAFKRIYPEKNNVLKYTTVTGVAGFEK